jgi:hypothetical protein
MSNAGRPRTSCSESRTRTNRPTLPIRFNSALTALLLCCGTRVSDAGVDGGIQAQGVQSRGDRLRGGHIQRPEQSAAAASPHAEAARAGPGHPAGGDSHHGGGSHGQDRATESRGGHGQRHRRRCQRRLQGRDCGRCQRRQRLRHGCSPGGHPGDRIRLHSHAGLG